MTLDWVQAAQSRPTPTPARWTGVTPSRRCPICGKPDWCSIDAVDGTVLCMRIADGTTKHVDLVHGTGYLHKANAPAMPARRSAPPVQRYVAENTQAFVLDYAAIWQRWHKQTADAALKAFASQLGVTCVSLKRLSVVRCKERNAWAFPMYDAIRHVVGIRLRADGRKFALPGSHAGLFIPAGLETKPALLICEGPTDTAAALSLGFDAIGRPSCSGGTEYICNLLQAGRRRNVAIIADADGPGRYGANQLADRLLGICQSVKVIDMPHPHKDLREWARMGCKKVSMQHRIEMTESTQ